MQEETQAAPADVEAASSAPVENAEVQPTTGSEAVTNTEETKQNFVPLERFQEVNNGYKELKEWKEQVQPLLEKQQQAQEPQGPEIDPDTEKLLRSFNENWAKENGFVRKSELDQERAAQQAEQDLKSFQAEKGLSEEDLLKVRDEAVKAGAQNKQGLVNAYNTIFMDKIIEDRVKEALAKQGGTFAEKPGEGGSQKPGTQPEIDPNMSSQDRIKARIRAAMAK